MLNNSWQTHEKELKAHLRTAKMMMSCRSHIINKRLEYYPVNQSDIVDLDDNGYKLSVDEKRQILRKYTSEVNLSEKDCDEIVSTVDKHFPVLCRLYFSKDEHKDNGIRKASPLYMACKYGHDIIVQFLLNYKADINRCTKKGASPLFIACKNGHHSTVKLLLENGAKLTLCKENEVSPLYVACQNGHGTIVKLLLDTGADIDYCTLYLICLIIACHSGQESTVQHLLSNGANKIHVRRMESVLSI